MIKKQRLAFILTALLTTFISSCSDFNKVAKSTDMEYKKEKAIQYYEAGEYKYSTPLLEELMPLYKHNVEGEKMYFYFAKGNYLLESYILAEYYLKRFIKTYPKSLYTEEAMFLAAMCSVKSSPDVVLDQTPTEQAIIDLQFFLNTYPNTSLKDSCNTIIDELSFKIETKDFEAAKQYFMIQSYKAAVTSLKAFVEKYAMSSYTEEAWFMLVESTFKLAVNSVDQKKELRMRNTLSECRIFADEFPESKHLNAIKSIQNKVERYLSGDKKVKM